MSTVPYMRPLAAVLCLLCLYTGPAMAGPPGVDPCDLRTYPLTAPELSYLISATGLDCRRAPDGVVCVQKAPNGKLLPAQNKALSAGLEAVCAARRKGAGTGAGGKTAPPGVFEPRFKTDMKDLKSAKGDLGPLRQTETLPGTGKAAAKKQPASVINGQPKKLSPDMVKVPAMPVKKPEEPSLGGFLAHYQEGMSNHIYEAAKDDVVGDRYKSKDPAEGARAEHEKIMERLIDYHTQYHDNKLVKTGLDVFVGAGATLAYNFVAGPAGGVYEVVTGNEAGGLGLGGHVIVGAKDAVKGDFKKAWEHVRVGTADIVGDVQGIYNKVTGNFAGKQAAKTKAKK